MARKRALRFLIKSEDACLVECVGRYRAFYNWQTVATSDFPLLQKPFTPNELVRKVREVLDRN